MEDKFRVLAQEATIAVSVLADGSISDIELLRIKPNPLPGSEVDKLAEQWAPRGLGWIGIIGLVPGGVRAEFTEPIDGVRINALLAAFARYCEVLNQGTEQEQPQEHRGDFEQFAERLMSLEDPRTN